MKLLLLSDHSSSHTIKWANSLSNEKDSVCIFGLSSYNKNVYNNNIKIYSVGFNPDRMRDVKSFSKFYYLKALPVLKKIIKEFNPDILHAHYATSYGLLGALSGFHPFIISVWGSDIFDFPKKSILHKLVLKYNLSKADKILSTSSAMAVETQLYTSKKIEITPFGVDLDVFKKNDVKNLFNKNDIVIGTVKALEKDYGIDYLIKAFGIIKNKYPELSIKLLIVGGGSLENNLKLLCKELDIKNHTIFTGKIDFAKVPDYYNMLDVYVALSNNESFGVAIIEALACEKPVVVSNVGGLPEIVKNEHTGLIVPAKDTKKLALAIERLIMDKNLRTTLGENGRKRVIKYFNWKDNVQQMIGIYNALIEKNKK